MPTGFYLGDLLSRGSRPVSRCKIHQWRDKVDQMMWHAAPLCQWRLCRRYLNALIDLDRVAVNNLAADAPRQLDPQLALSGSCGTDNGNDARSADIPSACFGFVACFDWSVHPREMISLIAITNQMSRSNTMPPMI